MPNAFDSQDFLRGQSTVIQQGLDPFRSGRNNGQPVSQSLPEIVFQGTFPVVEFPWFNLHSNPTLSQNIRLAQWDGSQTGAVRIQYTPEEVEGRGSMAGAAPAWKSFYDDRGRGIEGLGHDVRGASAAVEAVIGRISCSYARP